MSQDISHAPASFSSLSCVFLKDNWLQRELPSADLSAAGHIITLISIIKIINSYPHPLPSLKSNRLAGD